MPSAGPDDLLIQLPHLFRCAAKGELLEWFQPAINQLQAERRVSQHLPDGPSSRTFKL